ncbi:Hypothetical Protein FCC1311_070702 [Hondaea fermentalgiana]|uniref:Uncharacterized protein n=1 Tax=Hondaea fermentalgiana TaxID=2315210 RepID=A0A2R5GIY5_9STRA|nr:Hypothetical Protein FCC1311_070702 [Hondaea fermentalgiana]|eukprot:GBG30850.1 Hypothetical Protein FCC1311_070702 [Hondaea fermentalgiana]
MLLLNGSSGSGAASGLERGSFGLGPLRRTKSAYFAKKTSVVAAAGHGHDAAKTYNHDKTFGSASAAKAAGSLRSVRSAASVLGGAAKAAKAAASTKPSLKRLSPSQSRARAASSSSSASTATAASTTSAVLVLPKLASFAEGRRSYRPRRNAVHERMDPGFMRTFNVDFRFEHAEDDDDDDDDIGIFAAHEDEILDDFDTFSSSGLSSSGSEEIFSEGFDGASSGRARLPRRSF